MGYFEQKATGLAMAILPPGAHNPDRIRIIQAVLERVADDQREACLRAYYDAPEEMDWDLAIKRATIED